MAANSNPWWEAYSHITANYPGFAEFIADESSATGIRSYFMTLMPGLLQTEAYARAVFQHILFFDNPELIEDSVRLRMDRQWHTLERAEPPRLRAIIGEQVLYRQLGGAEVLRGQLQHLLDMMQQPWLQLRIMPLAGFTTPFILDPGSFGLFQQGDKGQVLYRDDEAGRMVGSRNHVELQYYRQGFDHAASAALTPLQSQHKVTQRLAELARPQNGQG